MSRFTAVMVAAAGLALSAGAGSAFGQLGDGSIGTVQVDPPTVDIQIEPEAASVTASVAPPAGDSQTARASVGTVQAAPPGVNAGASASPSQAGTEADPDASFSAGTTPGTGGPQTADRSVGTAQIGGAGSQTATNSIGTAQIAPPATQAEGSVHGPLRPDMPDGALTPEADLAANVDPAQGGPQSADGSTGTVQIGGGSQTARNSTGTAQIAVPAVQTSAGGGGSFASAPDGSVALTPSGSPPTAEGSTGTLQIGASPPSTVSGDAGVLPTAAQPLSLERNGVPLGGRTPAGVATPSNLPFTGLGLGFVVLLAFALLASGYVVRRGSYTAA
jgi:hypothetical protein